MNFKNQLKKKDPKILVEAKNLYCEFWFARAGVQATLLVALSLRLF
jgi:hypothetical protein